MFKVYSASAGSGKTYTLTKEYLRLALGGGKTLTAEFRDTYFRHILAITFTNAAANEMKERILRELTRIAAFGPQDLTDLLAVRSHKEMAFLVDLTSSLTSIPPNEPAFVQAVQEVQRRCARLFKAILHRYSEFSVTTIDSFTQRLVTAFTDELGLPFSFEVEMDTPLALELAVDNLIERVGTDEMAELTEILHELVQEAARSGKSWYQIAAGLQAFGKVLTSDQHFEAVGQIASLSTGQIRAIRKNMLTYIAETERQIQAQGKEAVALIEGAGVALTDFKGAKSSIGTFFQNIAEGKLADAPGKYASNAAVNNEWYTLGKKRTAIHDKIDGMADELAACYSAIVAGQTNQLLNLYRDIAGTLQKLALLKQIREEFVALLRKNNQVHISEFSKRIKAIVEEEPIPFLFERLGSKYNHLLIDEFQDTSKLQFANLMPLIENALSSGHTNMAVGDGKQAIYRFRGGDMDQIVALHRRKLGGLQQQHGTGSWTAERINTLHGRLEPSTLTTNYRSAKPIVAFNNAFFSEIALLYANKDHRVAAVYDALQTFHQEPAPSSPDTAHIQFEFIDAESFADKRAREAAMVKLALERVQQVRADGFAYKDIAVLTRTKKEAKLIANALNQLDIPLTSADSLSLQFSEPIRFLISLLNLLGKPEQPAIRYEVLYLFHCVVKHQIPNDEQTEELRQVAESGGEQPVLTYLADQGYGIEGAGLAQLTVYELTEKMAHRFGLFDRPHDQPFLFRFLDEIMTFCSRQSGHLTDFLRYWETACEKVSVSGGLKADAVTIQTIHKAKGLEYPVVILPFANWTLGSLTNETMWIDLSNTATPELSIPGADGTLMWLLNAQIPLSKRMEDMTPDVVAQYANEKSLILIENLNTLYVAFTRPTTRLYVITTEEKFDGKSEPGTVAYWLHIFLKNSEFARQAACGWTSGQAVYTLTCHPTPPTPEPGVTTIGPDGSAIQFQSLRSGSRGQNMQLRRMAERVFDTATFEQHRERDRKLCAALSLIKGADCVGRSLAKLVREGTIRAVEVAELQESLTAIVNHPELADVFGYDRRIDTDRSILTRKSAKGAPHRVVHCPDGRLVLVQYESAGEKGTSHLSAFIDLYKEMGYTAVDGRLVWLSNVPVVNCL